MSYDVIIPVVKRNLITLPIAVRKLRENMCVDSIIIVGDKSLHNKTRELNCSFIEENELISGLTYGYLKECICRRDRYAGKRTGWYLQQFIKMGYALICDKKEYLIWDADTIPLKRICMHNQKGQCYFDVKDEYNRPYFYTMKKLFGMSIKHLGFSFVSEHMIVITSHMRELISLIEKNANINGTMFFEKVLNAINEVDLLKSGFSEYETYGNYICMYWPEEYVFREINSLRDVGHRFYSITEIENRIAAIRDEYDIVTIENR